MIEAMNSASSKSIMAGNHKIISPESIRLDGEDMNIRNISSDQWQQHTLKSGNLTIQFERMELAISREIAMELHETRSPNRPTSKLIRGKIITRIYSPILGVPPTAISSPKDGQVTTNKNFGDSKVIRTKDGNAVGETKLGKLF